MDTPYIEKDCVFTFEGKSFESGGAVVANGFAIGYMSNAMHSITDWHGNHLGYAKITASWPINSFMTDRMYQVKAVINDIAYTGRTAGGSCIWKGKRCK